MLSTQGTRVGGAGKSSLKKLRMCTRHAPDNTLNKIYLIEAERFAARGKKDNAVAKFRQSLNHAEEQKFTHEEALAAERAGFWLLEWGDTELASPMLERAHRLYERWGSPLKASQVSALLVTVEKTKA